MKAGLTQIEPSQAADLYAPWCDQLATQAVVAGAVPGRVWVDDPRAPTLALMHVSHRLYLAGSTGAPAAAVERLGSTLIDGLLAEVKARGEGGLVLYYLESDWLQTLQDNVFAGRTIYPGRHNVYLLDNLDAGWQLPDLAPLPAGMALVEVDETLLARSELRNHAELLEELQSERPSVAAFLKESFGVCIVSSDAVVTWCLSEYNLGDRCEIGIATDEAHRRQGLATLTAAHMIRQAAARGIRRVGWHCWLRNEPSNATARKLGFRLAAEHGAIFLPA